MKFSDLPKSVQAKVQREIHNVRFDEAKYNGARYFRQNGFSSYEEYFDYLLARPVTGRETAEAVVSVMVAEYAASGWAGWMDGVPNAIQLCREAVQSNHEPRYVQ